MVCLPPLFCIIVQPLKIISCNDLILLIVIQKKLSLPPNNHPGGIKGPEKRPIQNGLYPGKNKKRKDEGKKNPRNRLRGVWPVSLRSGALAVAWGCERQSLQHAVQQPGDLAATSSSLWHVHVAT